MGRSPARAAPAGATAPGSRDHRDLAAGNAAEAACRCDTGASSRRRGRARSRCGRPARARLRKRRSGRSRMPLRYRRMQAPPGPSTKPMSAKPELPENNTETRHGRPASTTPRTPRVWQCGDLSEGGLACYEDYTNISGVHRLQPRRDLGMCYDARHAHGARRCTRCYCLD